MYVQLLSSALAVMMAEVADKTMMATVSSAIMMRRYALVLLISVLSFIIANITTLMLAVLLKVTIGFWMRYLSAALFVAVGLLYLAKEEEEIIMKARGGLAALFLLILTSEMGDKTQLAVLALAVRSEDLIAVIIGAVIGYALLNSIMILVFIKLAKRLIPRGINKIVGAVFIVAGILSLVI
ncbi:MAG: hypothetical protein DRN15_08675 [Thermoprotei archaeon]|nr:MAG: hypothetical protein DRN15_08675 [Thermoprotei archaeon]RLF22892.1 MAG: hypothetical protein DRM97_05325 [Thermoprotei archaeon]